MVPAATPITKPLVGLMVATDGLLLFQVPPTLPLLVNVVAKPTHNEDAPLIVPALGIGFTVTRWVAVDVPHTSGDPTV